MANKGPSQWDLGSTFQFLLFNGQPRSFHLWVPRTVPCGTPFNYLHHSQLLFLFFSFLLGNAIIDNPPTDKNPIRLMNGTKSFFTSFIDYGVSSNLISAYEFKAWITELLHVTEISFRIMRHKSQLLL